MRRSTGKTPKCKKLKWRDDSQWVANSIPMASLLVDLVWDRRYQSQSVKFLHHSRVILHHHRVTLIWMFDQWRIKRFTAIDRNCRVERFRSINCSSYQEARELQGVKGIWMSLFHPDLLRSPTGSQNKNMCHPLNRINRSRRKGWFKLIDKIAFLQQTQKSKQKSDWV